MLRQSLRPSAWRIGIAATVTMVLLPVTASACLLPGTFIVQKTGPATVRAGEDITYTFTLSNTSAAGSGQGAGGIIVFDDVPAGLTLKGWQGTIDLCAPFPYGPQYGMTAAAIQCHLPFLFFLMPQQSVTFQLTFATSPSLPCGQVIRNTAHATESGHMYPQSDAAADTTVVCDASSSSSSSSVGSSATSSSSLSSSSSSASSSLSSSLPSSSSVSSVSSVAPQVGCIQVTKETFTAQGQRMSPVEPFGFQLDGGQTIVNDGAGRAQWNGVSVGSHTVTEAPSAGWQQRAALPSGGVVQVTAGGNCATVLFQNQQQTLIPPPPIDDCRKGDVTIEKTADRYEAQPGDVVEYAVIVRNRSNRRVTDVRIEDAIDRRDAIVVDAGGGDVSGDVIRIRWNDLQAGESRRFSYRVRLGLGLRHGDRVENRARVDSSCGDDDADALVRIIEELPQTGARTLTGQSPYLEKIKAGEGMEERNGGIAAMIVTVIAGAGMAIWGAIQKIF